jgi:transcriptional regulator with XRE-family HTH domain
MGRESALENRFRERVKKERDRRGWSQADVAKMLGDKGIKGIYPTTVAKIESGERAVRIDEATALADLFAVPLDALLGRKHHSQEDELAYLLRLLRDTARQSSQQVWATMETIREQLEELPGEFDNADMLQKLGYATWSNRLYPAYDALMGLVNLSQELLRREQGRPELSEEALKELEVPPPERTGSFEELKAFFQRPQEGPGDEAQS